MKAKIIAFITTKDADSQLWVNPLMTIFWRFDSSKLIKIKYVAYKISFPRLYMH